MTSYNSLSRSGICFIIAFVCTLESTPRQYVHNCCTRRYSSCTGIGADAQYHQHHSELHQLHHGDWLFPPGRADHE